MTFEDSPWFLDPGRPYPPENTAESGTDAPVPITPVPPPHNSIADPAALSSDSVILPLTPPDEDHADAQSILTTKDAQRIPTKADGQRQGAHRRQAGHPATCHAAREMRRSSHRLDISRAAWNLQLHHPRASGLRTPMASSPIAAFAVGPLLHRAAGTRIGAPGSIICDVGPGRTALRPLSESAPDTPISIVEPVERMMDLVPHGRPSAVEAAEAPAAPDHLPLPGCPTSGSRGHRSTPRPVRATRRRSDRHRPGLAAVLEPDLTLEEPPEVDGRSTGFFQRSETGEIGILEHRSGDA